MYMVRKEHRIYENNSNKNLERKYKIWNKNTSDGINNRLDFAEEKKISELEDLAMGAIRKLIVVQRTNAHVAEALESKRREGGSRG